MTQGDVLKLLTKYSDKWFSSKDIQLKLSIGSTAANENLRKLTKDGFAIRIQVPCEHRRDYVYKLK